MLDIISAEPSTSLRRGWSVAKVAGTFWLWEFRARSRAVISHLAAGASHNQTFLLRTTTTRLLHGAGSTMSTAKPRASSKAQAFLKAFRKKPVMDPKSTDDEARESSDARGPIVVDDTIDDGFQEVENTDDEAGDDDVDMDGSGAGETAAVDKKASPANSSLAPISSIPAIFTDLVSRIPEVKKVTERIEGRKLRVATMCSGTESPLLALDLIQDSIEELYGAKLDIEHVFSCEIEPFKQAYIERNFSPPILFRDICELGDDEA